MPPPGFWSGYWHYLTNPWEMDRDLEVGFYAAAGTAAVAGTAAAGVAAAGYGTVTVGQAATAIGGSSVASTVASEVLDTGIETAIEAATGKPVILPPMSPSDAVQDGGKLVLKRILRDKGDDAAERLSREICPSPSTGVVVPTRGGIDEPVLFGQKRVGPSFSPDPRPPPH